MGWCAFRSTGLALASPSTSDAWMISPCAWTDSPGRHLLARLPPPRKGSRRRFRPSGCEARFAGVSELPTYTATRYLQPLREGGSLPAVVDTEGGGLFVVKFRG